jgi:glycoside/pentoside/hexuronide:cation symporter, GPH family
LKTQIASADRSITRGWRLGVYASGNFGKNILWGTGEVTLLFMLTDMLGMDPALAGGLLLASLVFDAMLDPVVGYTADRFQSPLGKYGALILAGAPLASLSFVALYSLPLLERPSIALAFLLICAFRFGYSLIDTPHNALISRVRPDGPGRARLAGYRFFFSSLAALVLAFAIAPMVNSETRTLLSPSGLFTFAAVVAGLSAFIMVASWAAVRRVDTNNSPTSPTRGVSVGQAVAAAASSPMMVTTLIVGTLAAFALPLFNKSVLYIASAVLERPDWTSPVLISLVAGQFAALGPWIAMSSRYGKMGSLAGAHLVAAIGAGLCLTFGLQGLAGLLVGAFVFGAGACGVYTIIWGLVADGVDDVAARSEVMPEGRLFAFAIFLQKAAIGLAVGLFGLALSWANYEPGTHQAVANGVILGFGLVIPAVAAICCAFLLIFRCGKTRS